jgi:hypothetical protein
MNNQIKCPLCGWVYKESPEKLAFHSKPDHRIVGYEEYGNGKRRKVIIASTHFYTGK